MNFLYDEDLPENLPEPAGWKILVRPIRVRAKTEGGIELPASSQEAQSYLRTVGQVIAMGPGCYSHPKFTGAAPWCKVGDWIRYRQHTGHKDLIKTEKGRPPAEFIYINDDEVIATAQTPDIWLQEV